MAMGNPYPDLRKEKWRKLWYIALVPLLLAVYQLWMWVHYCVFRSNLVLKVDFPRANDWCVRVRRTESKHALMVKQQLDKQLRTSLDQFLSQPLNTKQISTSITQDSC